MTKKEEVIEEKEVEIKEVKKEKVEPSFDFDKLLKLTKKLIVNPSKGLKEAIEPQNFVNSVIIGDVIAVIAILCFFVGFRNSGVELDVLSMIVYIAVLVLGYIGIIGLSIFLIQKYILKEKSDIKKTISYSIGANVYLGIALTAMLILGILFPELNIYLFGAGAIYSLVILCTNIKILTKIEESKLIHLLSVSIMLGSLFAYQFLIKVILPYVLESIFGGLTLF